ncbi:hypothetical protein [Pedobacter sp.]|uniref:hypothetical protein n=1 Tax=Pedobacter sp. TaxID=1411316 RepID=UPI003D7F94C9
MKKLNSSFLVLCLLIFIGCGSNESPEQQTDSTVADTMATDSLAADKTEATPQASGDTSQAAFPSSRKSNTQ